MNRSQSAPLPATVEIPDTFPAEWLRQRPDYLSEPEPIEQDDQRWVLCFDYKGTTYSTVSMSYERARELHKFITTKRRFISNVLNLIMPAGPPLNIPTKHIRKSCQQGLSDYEPLYLQHRNPAARPQGSRRFAASLAGAAASWPTS